MFFCEVFDVYGINFMGHFLVSFSLVTFYLLLIMFQTGLKQSSLGLMIQKLLQILSDQIFFVGLEYLELS